MLEDRLNYIPLALLTFGNGLRVIGYLLKDIGLNVPIVIGYSGIFILIAIVSFAIMLITSLK